MNNMHHYFMLFTVMYAAVGAKQGCYDLPAFDQPVYFNWPIYLDCYEVASACDFYQDYQCTFTISGSGVVLHTEEYNYYDDYYDIPGYNIPNVTIDIPSEIEITIQTLESGDCCSKLIHLHKQKLPEGTCQEALARDEYSGGTTRTYPNSRRQLSCMIPGTSNAPRLQSISSYNITWYYDCSKTLPEGVRIDSVSRLQIDAFDQFKHTGTYFCSIEHNEETRYIIRYTLCAEQPSSMRRISVICETEKNRYRIGETARISCTAKVGSLSTSPHNYHMNFYPLFKNGSRNIQQDRISCAASLGRNSCFSPDRRVSCSFSPKKTFKKICFHHIPTEEEWNEEKKKSVQTLTMTYEIRNIQEDEFIMYEAFVSSGSRSNNSTYVVEIMKEDDEEQTQSV